MTSDAVAWLLDERTEPSEAQNAYMAWWSAEQREEIA